MDDHSSFPLLIRTRVKQNVMQTLADASKAFGGHAFTALPRPTSSQTAIVSLPGSRNSALSKTGGTVAVLADGEFAPKLAMRPCCFSDQSNKHPLLKPNLCKNSPQVP